VEAFMRNGVRNTKREQSVSFYFKEKWRDDLIRTKYPVTM